MSNYIKMCKKAEEIQKVWKPALGHWVHLKSVVSNYKTSLITNEYPPIRYYRNQSIWLPTQEQLQEMVLEDFSSFTKVGAFYDFLNYYIKKPECERIEFSMNELWLAFVMKKKYQKIWLKEDWVLCDFHQNWF